MKQKFCIKKRRQDTSGYEEHKYLVKRSTQVKNEHLANSMVSFDNSEDLERCQDLVVMTYALLSLAADKVDEMTAILTRYDLLAFGTKKAANDADRAFKWFCKCVEGHIKKGKTEEFNVRFMGDYTDMIAMIDDYVEGKKEVFDKIVRDAPEYIWLTEWLNEEVKGHQVCAGPYSVKYQKIKTDKDGDNS